MQVLNAADFGDDNGAATLHRRPTRLVQKRHPWPAASHTKAQWRRHGAASIGRGLPRRFSLRPLAEAFAADRDRPEKVRGRRRIRSSSISAATATAPRWANPWGRSRPAAHIHGIAMPFTCQNSHTRFQAGRDPVRDPHDPLVTVTTTASTPSSAYLLNSTVGTRLRATALAAPPSRIRFGHSDRKPLRPRAAVHRAALRRARRTGTACAALDDPMPTITGQGAWLSWRCRSFTPMAAATTGKAAPAKIHWAPSSPGATKTWSYRSYSRQPRRRR